MIGHLFAPALPLLLVWSASADDSLFDPPITPSKYHHYEYEELGYKPAYCPGASPSFDRQHRPYIVVNYPYSRVEPPQASVPGHIRDLMFLRADGWHFVNLEAVLRDHFGDKGAFSGYSRRVEFIADTDEMFLLVQYQREDGRHELAMITSEDHCETFQVHPVCATHDEPYARMDTEHFAGHNRIGWPMLIGVNRRREEPEDRGKDYPSYFYYFILDKVDGRVRAVDTGLLSEMASRNPIASMYVNTSIVSTPDKIHIVWHDTTFEGQRWDNKVYAATYRKRDRGWVNKQTYLGPSKDDHGFPTLVLDSKHYLHVLCGSHVDIVPYARSTRPDVTEFPETRPIPGISKATHLSLICDLEDRLHLFFRDNVKYSGDRSGLSYARKEKGQQWQKPVRLANSPQPGYCRMCNNVSMDKRGRLSLNYGYFTLDYRSEGKVEGWYYPVLAYSKDRGDTWRLAPDDFDADLGE